MEQNPQTDPAVLAAFKRRRLRQWMLVVPLVIAFIPVAMLEDAGPNGLLGVPTKIIGPLCIAMILAMVIFSFVNWRCPACNTYLGKSISPRFCQKCGARLQDG